MSFASTGVAVWFWFTCLIGLVWLRRHLDINRAKRDPVLQPQDADSLRNAAPPRLSVLVAAKDEEANIARCVDGLLAQDYPNFELIVIDDRSTDRTGAILDEYARRDPRCVALHIKELRAGWFGKNNAMRAGVEQSNGEWLCFSDADCAFDSPQLLSAAVGFARREHVDFLSVLPRLEALTFWEKVVQPVAGGILVFWYPPQKVNHPKSPRAYANGAFMLLSRKTYETLGGHEPVKTELNEDMHLARLTKEKGLRLRVIRCGDMYRVRMYTGLRAIWRGWSRIFYGCFGTLPRLLASVLLLSLFSLSPYLTLLLAPLAGADGLWLAAAGGWAVLAQQSVLWRFYPLSGLAAGWALSYPLGALLSLGMTFNAITKLGGRTTTNWRGTTYRGSAVAAPEVGRQ